MAKRDHGGLIAEAPLECGAFITCLQIGGFTDVVSGLHVPGPTCEIDPAGRQVTSVSLRAPIQLPHAKLAYDPKDRSVKIEVPFFQYDELGESALQMALNTGILAVVPDQEVQVLWPGVWAQRKARIVHDPFKDARDSNRPILDLIADAKSKLAKARQTTNNARDKAEKSAK